MRWAVFSQTPDEITRIGIFECPDPVTALSLVRKQYSAELQETLWVRRADLDDPDAGSRLRALYGNLWRTQLSTMVYRGSKHQRTRGRTWTAESKIFPRDFDF